MRFNLLMLTAALAMGVAANSPAEGAEISLTVEDTTEQTNACVLHLHNLYGCSESTANMGEAGGDGEKRCSGTFIPSPSRQLWCGSFLTYSFFFLVGDARTQDICGGTVKIRWSSTPDEGDGVVEYQGINGGEGGRARVGSTSGYKSTYHNGAWTSPQPI